MVKKIKNKKIYIIALILLLLIYVFGSLILRYYNLYNSKKEYDSLKEFIKDETGNSSVDADFSDNKNIQENNSGRSNKVKELKGINSDIVGWLEIPDTNISYPILQGQDNSYYMKHNYKKEWTIDGSLFLDKDYDWEKPSDNLLIYGHNNRGSTDMFVDLLKYKNEEFYKEHPQIRFSTANEDGVYDIISVFISRVYYKRETDVFRYYYFIDANNKEEFDEYVNESKKANLYDINETAEYGDKLITLSTCDWTQKDGRFVVVARMK